ncbi:unnamed protein product [Rotaria sordida]|uniref:Ricin B lectin domain-containing protein n=1 Tax=Rotaria sordida TaxID=392033 RepID=A0A814J364_9BILA|nr:unnamed protein product [Rotaria sordida]CAF1095406.1 unnamed protein product [Rotaria sordida]
MATGMVINIDGGIKGSNLIIWPKNMGTTQQWQLDGLHILCPGANIVIDIEKSKTVSGAPVVAWSNHGGLNQQWNIVPKLR